MKKGMTQSACESRGKVMRKMKRHVWTGVGTSKETYQDEGGDKPLEDKLQGKGDVMTLWTLTSNAIMSIHEKNERNAQTCTRNKGNYQQT